MVSSRRSSRKQGASPTIKSGREPTFKQGGDVVRGHLVKVLGYEALALQQPKGDDNEEPSHQPPRGG